MQILSSINIDLQRPRAPIIVHAKQGDKLTRGVVVKLYNNGAEWTIPTEVTDVFVAFCKPDGKGGTYNKLPDNTTPACTKTGNTITAKFAPQVLTCAGLVRVDLKMVNAAEDVLKTFGFYVQVEEDAESGIKSEDYWKNATLAGLQAKIGDLENLRTSEKGSVVGAINEVIPDLFFCPDFKVWTGIGIEETIDGYEWYPHQNPHVGAIVVGGNGYTAVVTRTGDHTLTKSLGTQIFVPLMSARDVTYNGNIGDYEPKNVSAALEALMNYTDDKVGSIPVTKDATADYAASGASSVQEWATMAKTGDTTKYRVTAGRYQINQSEFSDSVVITDVPGSTVRVVKITECNSDPFVYMSVYSANSPGATPVMQVDFSSEENFLSVFEKNLLLPYYGAEDQGKVLTVDDGGFPKWKASAALPTVGAADNGAFMRVVNGAWAAAQLTDVSEVGA